MRILKQIFTFSTFAGLLTVLSTTAFAYTMTTTLKPTGAAYPAIAISGFHLVRAAPADKGDTWTDPGHQKSIISSVRFDIKYSDENEFLSNINNTFDIDFKCQKISVNDPAPFHTFQIKKATIREIIIEHKEIQTAVGIKEDPSNVIVQIIIGCEANPEQNDPSSGVTAADDWEARV